MESAKSNIQYSYAIDENKKLVFIDDVTEEYRKQHKYYCLLCGKELIARLGEKRIWHFAHKYENGEGNCNNESYLHKLGKLLIKQKFEEDNPFIISFRSFCFCHHKPHCNSFNENSCKAYFDDKTNVKEAYRNCEIEKEINGYKADVLLTSNDTRFPPILFEIKCTHKCTEEKINSGLQIIEINVESDRELRRIIDGDIIESSSITFYNFSEDAEYKLYKKTQMIMQSQFDQSETFCISQERHSICTEHKSCTLFDSLKCNKTVNQDTDLKKQYGKCSLNDINNDTGYALTFSNSQIGTRPLYCDLLCTSKCNRKANESNDSVIRICYSSLEQFEYIISHGIKEDGNTVFFDNIIIQKDELLSHDIQRIDINTFTIYKSGKYFIEKPSTDKNISCKTIQQHKKTSARFQMAFPEYKDDKDVCLMGNVLAHSLNDSFKSCYLCKHMKDISSGIGIKIQFYCEIEKEDGKMQNDPEPSKAYKCGNNYFLNEDLIKRYENQFKSFKYKIID